MLNIKIKGVEAYNEETEEFFLTKDQFLQLEHSLVSLSKWESKWCKPFLSKENKTFEETIDYIRCMTITQNVDIDCYKYITMDVIDTINKYIEHPMSATTFSHDTYTPNREIITAEIIYYWMITFNIPFECQKWHLNRLLTLIRVCNIKNKPSKKMPKKETYDQNRALNAARKAELNSKG